MQFSKQHPMMALLSAALIMPLLLGLYVAFEPLVAQGQVTDEFTVTQEITGEIAFEVPANDVTLSPTIAGLTGGTADGETSVRVSTNNPAGYTLDIKFAGATAMNYNSGSSVIPNFGAVQYDMNAGTVGANSAAFAFTASSTDVVTALQSSGTSCGSGSATIDQCWTLPVTATTDYTLVNSSNVTASNGQLTELAFRVVVTANPSPTLPIGLYTATATLTATEN